MDSEDKTHVRERPRVATRPPPVVAPPERRRRFVARHPSLALRVLGGALVVVAAALATCVGMQSAGCSSALRVQVAIADEASRAWRDVAMPATLDAYIREQRAAFVAHCAPDGGPCDGPLARQAAIAVRLRWAPVRASLERARAAHDRWRIELDRCRAARADGGVCAPESVDVYAREFADALLGWRCDVRRLGRSDLDIPGAAPTCPAPDAGSDAADGGPNG